MKTNHSTAETQYVDAGTVRYAYRSFGNDTGIPVVFLQHFTGTMDNWDPTITNGIAENHRVILFNNTGVSSTSGITPNNVDQMADDAIAFIKVLSPEKVNLLGFSLGGFIAQAIALKQPALVHKLILAGTGPEGSTGLDLLPTTLKTATEKEPVDRLLYMFFNDTENSKKAGLAFLNRLFGRSVNRDPDTTMETIKAQMNAIVSWGNVRPNGGPKLSTLHHPALIINGSNDRIVPTKNSYPLYEQLPNAWLSLYPDSAHGALFQYAELFVQQVTIFLQ